METSSIGGMPPHPPFQTESGLNKAQPGSVSASETQEPSDIRLSMKGQMMQQMSQMSDEEKAELKAFHAEMRSAVESGTFDAEAMAEKAPEAMKAKAEELGIELEELLGKVSELGGRPPRTYSASGMIPPEGSETEPESDAIDSLFSEEDEGTG